MALAPRKSQGIEKQNLNPGNVTAQDQRVILSIAKDLMEHFVGASHWILRCAQEDTIA